MRIRHLLLLISLTIAIFLIATFNHKTIIVASQFDCPGALPIRLTVGGSGKLSFTPTGNDPIPVRLREIPGKTSRVVGQLRGNVVFRILSGPQCKDNIAWWQVVGQGTVGWVAEGDNSGYFVEPEGTAAPTQSSSISDATPIILATPTLAPILAQSSVTTFAPFNPGSVETAGSVPPYQIAADFNNVVLTSLLSPAQLDYLQRNTFLVSPGDTLEYYELYQRAHDNHEPLYITADSLLHSFHLAFDKTLRTAESRYFLPLLRDLNKSLLLEADKNYQILKNTSWEDAALRTVAYLGTVARLADPSALVPEYASSLIASEIANVNAAAGVGQSAVFPELSNGEDWTQYQPRGHYTRNDSLQSYFRAMLYLGRMTFRLSHTEETKSALLLVSALRTANISGRSGVSAWNDLYEATGFFVGKSDALTVHQYGQVMDAVYGPNVDAKTLEGRGIDPFLSVAKTLPPIRIITSIVDSSAGANSETQGLRLMGQRFVWDAYAFSQLMYDRVGTPKKPRSLPAALDLYAAMGSDRALQLLDKDGTTTFENYTAQMTRLRTQLATLDESAWSSTLYDAWLYTVNTLNQPPSAGSPIFMSNQPYADRTLYSALGSFAELKHDTVLYAEQAAGTAGSAPPSRKGIPPEAPILANYVEPVPLFWARLAALAEMTDQGLGSRKLITSVDAEMLRGIADLARRFQGYATKELKNEALNPDDQAFLSSYGTILEGIVTAAADKPDGQGTFNLSSPPSAALITDIATDYAAGRVQHIATGRIFDMYVVIPANGQFYLTHGGVYSFYEFPFKGRLTNDTWQQMLDEGNAPDTPAWTFSFMANDTIPQSIADAVRSLQTNLRRSLWYSPVTRYTQLRESTDKAERYLASQLEPLARSRQYEGRPLVDMSFRAVQVAADGNTATVITRETWQGELHNSGPDDESDGPKIGVRGPYTIEVSYSLSKDSNGLWRVVDIAVNGDIPNWTNAQ